MDSNMGSKGWKAMAGLAALAVATCFALVWVARISSGTGYPMFSSLSSGPSGSKLLFEVLQRSGKFSSVDRSFLPQEQFHPLNSAVFYLGVPVLALGHMDDATLEHYEEIAQRGNRLVLGLTSREMSREARLREKSWRVKRWDISIRLEPAAKENRMMFRVLFGPEWRELNGTDIWERRFGSGAVRVVVASERLANRELAGSESSQAMVLALVTDTRNIWFEEGHLGVIESGSIAGLMRRYHMGGLVAGCLLITALLLWRNAARFPPAAADERDSETVVVGSDAHGMMTELLGRHLAAGQLVEICVAEWNRVEPRRRLNAARWRRQDPAVAYREIAAELGPKRIRKS